MAEAKIRPTKESQAQQKPVLMELTDDVMVENLLFDRWQQQSLLILCAFESSLYIVVK